jgi:ABC-type multidrug transport system fused ATPase/permease subunit
MKSRKLNRLTRRFFPPTSPRTAPGAGRLAPMFERAMARITLHDVTKSYGDGSVAVRGVSLDIADHEFVVLVGPSGCGKSTSLRMIAGLEDVTGGTISIDGQVVNALPARERNVAMVFQNYALYPHLTVFENMAFGLRLRKTPQAEVKQRVEEAARVLGLETLLERLPRALSGGRANGWLRAAPSYDDPPHFCSTNRSPIWTPNCAWRCVERLSGFTRRWTRRPFMCRTIRSRP